MSKEHEHEQTNSESTSRVGDAGASQVQSKLDEEQAQGFRGTEVDQTPNENYSVAGVTSGAPTPETDAEQKRKATKTGDNR